MKRVFNLSLFLFPILLIITLNNAFSDARKDIDDLLSSPDAVIFYVEPGEPGLKSDGTFVIGGKNYYINQDEKLMHDLKDLADEVKNNPSKTIGVFVAINLDSFKGKPAEENAALTGGDVGLRTAFAHHLLSKAGCSQKRNSPDFCNTDDIVLILESQNGINPKPFIAFLSYSPDESDLKQQPTSAPENPQTEPKCEKHHGRPESPIPPTPPPPPFKPCGKGKTLKDHKCNHEKDSDKKRDGFISLGMSLTSPTQPERKRFGQDFDWFPGADLAFSKGPFTGVCTIGLDDKYSYFGLAALWMLAKDDNFKLSAGIYGDRYDAYGLEAKRIGPGCEVEYSISDNVKLSMSASLRYVDWDRGSVSKTKSTNYPNTKERIDPKRFINQAATGTNCKIEICHNEGNGTWHTIEIAESAWPAHEAHGDHKGACTGNEDDGDNDGDDDDDNGNDHNHFWYQCSGLNDDNGWHGVVVFRIRVGLPF